MSKAVVLPILKWPDRRLRVKCKGCVAYNLAMSTVVADMKATCRAAGGVGLAAPQVGIQVRVIVTDIAKKMRVLIDPTVTYISSERRVEEEACLSLPGFRGAVERPKVIHVSYRDEDGDEDGERRHLLALDHEARVLQHEIDHLDGILYIDRMHKPLAKEIRNGVREKIARGEW